MPLSSGPLATDGAAVICGKFGACGAGEAWTATAKAVPARMYLEKPILMREKKWKKQRNEC